MGTRHFALRLSPRRRPLAILIIFVGLLLFWDASFSPGCSRDHGCNGALSGHISRIFFGNEKHITGSHYNGTSVSDHVMLPKSYSSQIVQTAVNFNDSVLLVFNPGLTHALYNRSQISCSYGNILKTHVASVEDDYVRCKHPPFELQASLIGSPVSVLVGNRQLDNVILGGSNYGRIDWKTIVYGWVPLQDEGDALLFVKGISRSKKSTLPDGVECMYGDNVKTQVVTFCQENVRCKLPPSSRISELLGKQVTIVHKDKVFPSVARLLPGQLLHNSDTGHFPKSITAKKDFYLCACTLVWNAAKFLKEWVMYHSHLGIQRFYLYDNNSEDDIVSVLKSLVSYNVSRHPWPWIKTQEASFSHCALLASEQCTWVAFIDVDEFIYPKQYLMSKRKRVPPLHTVIKQYDALNAGKLGQLKIANYNFGPSGLTKLPKSGQMLNYLCRMKAPKRVKSIVKTSAISPSYCSRVHYFELKPDFISIPLPRKDVIIHHYKYQVWDDFKMKFIRRAGTFVADWGQRKDLDSIDRTPGLGTEAVEPPDWPQRFCETKDTSLRDYVMSTSKFYSAGKLHWE